MKIPLSQGKFAIVDDGDYDWLNQWKWCISSGGYAIRVQHIGYFNGKKKQKTFRMHRIIMNAPDDMDIDHINGNALDNRRCNLRICTISQNLCNQKKTRGKSKYLGVDWHKIAKKWRAAIQINKKRYYLGCFISEIDAARAYNEAAKKLHGEFARLNVLC